MTAPDDDTQAATRLLRILARAARHDPKAADAFQAVLDHDPERLLSPAMRAAQQSSIAVVANALPAPPVPMIDREAETQELLTWLETGQSTPCVLVTGMPGAGKTALVLHVAHQAVARGWFPGGVLFVALRGDGRTESLSAEQALRSLLRLLGVPEHDVPSGVEAQAALYRAALGRRADQDGRMLVVADGAAASGQVLPLIPPSHAHKMVVTSRHVLGDLPAQLMKLPVLAPEAGAELLREVMLAGGRAEDRRPDPDDRTLRQIAKNLGGLPLALRIAGARLADDRQLTVAELASDLERSRTRLDALRLHDDTSVRAALGLSVQRLDPESARVFALLGLAPGADFSTQMADVLTGGQVQPRLAALAEAGLLTEHGTHEDRWSIHDLVRAYAAELLEHTENAAVEQAQNRLLEYYCLHAEAAAAHVRGSRDSPHSHLFHDAAHARMWIEAEEGNLLAVMKLAFAVRHDLCQALLTFWSYLIQPDEHRTRLADQPDRSRGSAS